MVKWEKRFCRRCKNRFVLNSRKCPNCSSIDTRVVKKNFKTQYGDYGTY